MKCKYPNRDLAARIDHSVCRYEGLPVYVRVDRDGTLFLYDLDNTGGKPVATIRSDDPMFDISTIPLGYVQENPTKVLYLSRKPHRRYKQGVDTESLSYSNLPRSSKVSRGFNILSKPFKDSLLGLFPDARQAIDNIRKSGKDDMEIAVTNKVALQFNSELNIINVYYRNEPKPVGWIPKDSYTVIVPSSDYAWIISEHLSVLNWEIK